MSVISSTTGAVSEAKVGGEGPHDPPSVRRWRDEVVRLREMIAEQKVTRTKLVWIVYLGVPLSLPLVFFHPLATVGGIAFAVTSWLTGRYFSWGHLIERGYQLKMAEKELRKERARAGLPEVDATLYARPAATAE